jgi:DNA-directed RNA polymerase subunit E'/Rpb7
MTDIFVPIRFKTNEQIPPSELENIDDFNSIVLKKLQKKLEGKCTRYGYIRPGSIEIIRRSIGMFIKQNFNGYLRYDIVCKADVCNPAIGTVLEAIVRNKNALGIHAESYLQFNEENVPVLDVIVPKKSAGIISEIDLDSIDVGSKINIEVLGKRYQLNDKKISIIARAIKRPSSTGAVTIANERLDGEESENIEDFEDDLEEVEENTDEDDRESSEKEGGEFEEDEDATRIAAQDQGFEDELEIESELGSDMEDDLEEEAEEETMFEDFE